MIDLQGANRLPYHQLLRGSRGPGWLPVLGAATILTGWMLAGIVIWSGQNAVREDPAGTVSWFGLLATNLTLISLIPLSILVARRLNHQARGLLSSVAGGLRWRPLAWFFMVALGVELVLLSVAYLAGIGVAGADAAGPAADAIAVIAVVLLTSTLQAAGEEYFFRGYLLQAAGALVRNPWFAILLTSTLFAMAHGVWPWDSPQLFLDRFAFGLAAGYLAVRTGGLEAPIAVHAVNNVGTFVLAALTDTVGGSLGVTSAAWSLVAADIVKFGVFAIAVVWICRREDLANLTPGPGDLPVQGTRRGLEWRGVADQLRLRRR
ncbi:CPBP family intramembrane glutamic endopeptidase [Kribbella sp. DT2]|uniref:CPBP family intramembrane glutamic endopeptidase n=1 Tax=Kribbella sp. DT2 TaxID=3393427 RepID=UPI003CF0B8F2